MSTDETASGRPLNIDVDPMKAVYGTRKDFTFEEALSVRDVIVRLVIRTTVDSNSWLSLYHLEKIASANNNFVSVEDLRKQSFAFRTHDELIRFVERLLQALGYSGTRRENFSVVFNVPLQDLYPATEFLVSLLLLEHDWERSIDAFRLRRDETVRFKIVGEIPEFNSSGAESFDASMRIPESTEIQNDDSRQEEFIRSEVKRSGVKIHSIPALKNIDKTNQAKAEGPKTPQVNPKDSKSSTLAAALLQMAADGLCTMDDVANMLKSMEAKSSDAKSEVSLFDGDFEDIKSRLGRLWQEEQEILKSPPKLSESKLAKSSSRSSGFIATPFLQTMNLTPFDGRKRSADDARQWLRRFCYYADHGNWSDEQRVDSLRLHLSGPALYWFKQLDQDDKRSWSLAQAAFRLRFCSESESARRRYYKLQQKPDESPREYLHRLNVGAEEAGIDFKNYLADARDHLHQFYDTLSDRKLADQLRMRACESVRTLEDVLHVWEATHWRGDSGRYAGRSTAYGGSASRNSSFEQHRASSRKAAVAALTSTEPSTRSGRRPMQPTSGARANLVCDHCGKTGHTQDRCFKLTVCRHCNKKGHTILYCVEHARKLISDQEQRASVAAVEVPVQQGITWSDELQENE